VHSFPDLFHVEPRAVGPDLWGLGGPGAGLVPDPSSIAGTVGIEESGCGDVERMSRPDPGDWSDKHAFHIIVKVHLGVNIMIQ